MQLRTFGNVRADGVGRNGHFSRPPHLHRCSPQRSIIPRSQLRMRIHSQHFCCKRSQTVGLVGAQNFLPPKRFAQLGQPKSSTFNVSTPFSKKCLPTLLNSRRPEWLVDVSLALWSGDQPILCSGRLRKTALGRTIPFSYTLRRPYPSFQSHSSSSSPFHFQHPQCHCFPALEGYFRVFIFPGDVIGQGLNFRGERVRLEQTCCWRLGSSPCHTPLATAIKLHAAKVWSQLGPGFFGCVLVTSLCVSP